MATTTTNYGFDIPQSTDLVKDGATAIATLGQDIDTAMNTALGTKKAGMVLLNTTSFSGVSSVSLPANTFNSTYENYRLIFTSTPSTVQELRLRGRTSGADNTNNNYNYQIVETYATTVSYIRSTANTYGYVGYTEADSIWGIEIYRPFLSASTAWSHLDNNGLNTTAPSFRVGRNAFNGTTSFDSMTIYASAGTMTGNYSVYGYNK